MKWTPISQGYPSSSRSYIFYVTVFEPKYGEDDERIFVTEATYLYNDRWAFYMDEMQHYDTSEWKVIAWMEKPPLPEPYNGE
jgi:hypothetical protein